VYQDSEELSPQIIQFPYKGPQHGANKTSHKFLEPEGVWGTKIFHN